MCLGFFFPCFPLTPVVAPSCMARACVPRFFGFVLCCAEMRIENLQPRLQRNCGFLFSFLGRALFIILYVARGFLSVFSSLQRRPLPGLHACPSGTACAATLGPCLLHPLRKRVAVHARPCVPCATCRAASVWLPMRMVCTVPRPVLTVAVFVPRIGRVPLAVRALSALD
jgi:hypothetical protein